MVWLEDKFQLFYEQTQEMNMSFHSVYTHYFCTLQSGSGYITTRIYNLAWTLKAAGFI